MQVLVRMLNTHKGQILQEMKTFVYSILFRTEDRSIPIVVNGS